MGAQTHQQSTWPSERRHARTFALSLSFSLSIKFGLLAPFRIHTRKTRCRGWAVGAGLESRVGTIVVRAAWNIGERDEIVLSKTSSDLQGLPDSLNFSVIHF